MLPFFGSIISESAVVKQISIFQINLLHTVPSSSSERLVLELLYRSYKPWTSRATRLEAIVTNRVQSPSQDVKRKIEQRKIRQRSHRSVLLRGNIPAGARGAPTPSSPDTEPSKTTLQVRHQCRTTASIHPAPSLFSISSNHVQ